MEQWVLLMVTGNMPVKDKKGEITTTYGNYVTVWKRQPDGKWKYVLDGGNTTPAPL